MGSALAYDLAELDDRKRMGTSHRPHLGPEPGVDGPALGNQAVLRRLSPASEQVQAKPAAEEMASKAAGKALSYAQVAKLVQQNNYSGQSDALVIALIYKESTFEPSAKAKGSTASGLMQMTKTALKELQRVYPGEFASVDLTDPAQNVCAGCKYLALMIKRAKGDVTKGLEKFGTGPGYAASILAAEKALNAGPADPMAELRRLVHP